MSFAPSRLEFEQLLSRFETSERRHAAEIEALTDRFVRVLERLDERIAILEEATRPE